MIRDKLREASQPDVSVIQHLAALSNGWLTDENFIRPVLSDIARKWKDLGLPGQSNYRESPTEADALRVGLGKTRATQQLREHLKSRLGCDADGRVPIGRWEEVLRRYREEYRHFVEALVEKMWDTMDKESAVHEADALWPLDQR